MFKGINLPTWLTLGRLAAPLVICPFILLGWSGWAAALFILAALTDWLDGVLARRWNMASDWGRILDPVADKVLVLLTLLALAVGDRLSLLVLILVFLLFFFSGNFDFSFTGRCENPGCHKIEQT